MYGIINAIRKRYSGNSSHSAACRVCRCEQVAGVVGVDGTWAVRDNNCMGFAGDSGGCEKMADSAGPFEVQVTSYVIDLEFWAALPRSKIVAEIECLHFFLARTSVIYPQLQVTGVELVAWIGCAVRTS